MKIKDVQTNNHKKAFEITTSNGQGFEFPYSQLKLKPSPKNPIAGVEVDKELGKEAFTYTLQSGDSDTVHIDHVLHYVQAPSYVRELWMHQLSLELQRVVNRQNVAKNELQRRMGTSASQFNRLLDPNNTRKSIDQMLELFSACECDVDVTINGKSLFRQIRRKASVVGTLSTKGILR